MSITNYRIKQQERLERILIKKFWTRIRATSSGSVFWRKGDYDIEVDEIGLWLYYSSTTVAGLAWSSLSGYLRGDKLGFPNGKEIEL